MFKDLPEEKDRLREHIHQQFRTVFQMEDVHGIQVIGSLTRILQLIELLDSQTSDRQELSASRWRLLVYLFMAEKSRQAGALSPTELSHFQQVSKNTISALLRGLEEQGYIQRELDPDDLRAFRIRLTEAGRQVVLSTAPQRIAALNQMLNGLDADETQELMRLLRKLRHSLEAQACQLQKDQT